MNEKHELVKWFESIKNHLPKLPFLENIRNSKLRPQILQQLVSQFLSDDERAKYYGLPDGCRMREGAKIIDINNLKIGKDCWIGENAILDASGSLEIGSHTSIGLSVYVWTHSSHLCNLTLNNKPGNSLIIRNKTTIGSGCFIAGPSVILPGVHIGDKCIVRPFSLVEKDIPDRSIYDNSGIKEGVLTDQLVARMVATQQIKGHG